MNSQRLNDLVKGKYGRKIAYTNAKEIAQHLHPISDNVLSNP